MNSTYSITVTVVVCLFSATTIAKDFDRKLESRKYWKGKIAEDYANGIVNDIPSMVDERDIEKKQFDQSTDDAHLAKLKIRFFSFVKRDKMNQARAISKMMVKRGDYTGESYLQSLDQNLVT